MKVNKLFTEDSMTPAFNETLEAHGSLRVLPPDTSFDWDAPKPLPIAGPNPLTMPKQKKRK
jgi:hypothetical protein